MSSSSTARPGPPIGLAHVEVDPAFENYGESGMYYLAVGDVRIPSCRNGVPVELLTIFTAAYWYNMAGAEELCLGKGCRGQCRGVRSDACEGP